MDQVEFVVLMRSAKFNEITMDDNGNTTAIIFPNIHVVHESNLNNMTLVFVEYNIKFNIAGKEDLLEVLEITKGDAVTDTMLKFAQCSLLEFD